MPDYTVSGDVDSMLRSANDAAIRSAIGVGTTDAPTFLSVTAATFATGSGAVITGNGGAALNLDASTIRLKNVTAITWLDGTSLAASTADLFLVRDGATGILAQRNFGTAQTFRVYNSTDATPATNFDRASFGFPTGTNTLRIGTENGGTYTLARPIDFVTGGAVRMSIAAAGGVTVSGDLIGSNSVRIGSGAGQVSLFVGGSGILRLVDTSFADFGRIQLGGTTSAFPAIKRTGTGIDIVLANDSGFAPLAAAKLELVTTAATGVRESILRASVSDNATSAFHIYNATFVDGKFVPGFSGSVFDSTTPASLFFAGQTDAANDTGTSPLMIFTARTTTSTTDPNNGINGSVTTRPLFTWWNNNATQMQMSANGNLGIGTTTPASKLQVSAGDIEVDTIAKGVILKSPDGTRYRVTAANGGTLSVTAV